MDGICNQTTCDAAFNEQPETDGSHKCVVKCDLEKNYLHVNGTCDNNKCGSTDYAALYEKTDDSARTCVCDDTKGFTLNEQEKQCECEANKHEAGGECKCDAALNMTVLGETCVCVPDKNLTEIDKKCGCGGDHPYWALSGQSCVPECGRLEEPEKKADGRTLVEPNRCACVQGAQLVGGACECDATAHWIPEDTRCRCDPALRYSLVDGQCACDATLGLVPSGEKCACGQQRPFWNAPSGDCLATCASGAAERKDDELWCVAGDCKYAYVNTTAGDTYYMECVLDCNDTFPHLSGKECKCVPDKNLTEIG